MIKLQRNATGSLGGFENSISHSWWGIPSAGATLGATVNSTSSTSGNFCMVNFMAFSTSSPITCSPKAEIKCLILPLTISRYGFFRNKLHRITNGVSPQPCIAVDDHRIIFSKLHLFDG